MQCRVAELTEFQDSFTGISSQFKGQTNSKLFRQADVSSEKRTNLSTCFHLLFGRK